MVYYVFDGTRVGFYTAVFDAWKDKSGVIARGNVQVRLVDSAVKIETDLEKAERVRKKVGLYDNYALTEIDDILRSDDLSAPDVAYRYLRAVMAHRAPVRARLAENGVTEAMHLLQKIRREEDRFRGFLRFSEMANGVLYAPFAPDNDILELLMPHFMSRYQCERFVIHDVKREIAGMYNGKNAVITYLPKGELEFSDEEQAFSALWKDYYNAVNIKERKHTKQMKGYMPVRYWDFLTEKN